MDEGNRNTPEGIPVQRGVKSTSPSPEGEADQAGLIGVTEEGVASSLPARFSPEGQPRPDELFPTENSESQDQPAEIAKSKASDDSSGTDTESNAGEPDPIVAAEMGPEKLPSQPTASSQAPSAERYRTQSSEQPTFIDLLGRYDLARAIVSHLDFYSTVSFSDAFPEIKSVCDDHILHDIIPETEVKFYTQRTGELKERDELFPVIKRIKRERRVLPTGKLIVYEPKEYRKRCGGLRLGEFVPASIDFLLPGSRTELHWVLKADQPDSPSSYRFSRNARDMRAGGERSRTLRTLYYTFDDLLSISGPGHEPEQFPIKVWYKKSDEEIGSHRFHALSIPYDSLVDRLIADGSSGKGATSGRVR